MAGLVLFALLGTTLAACAATGSPSGSAGGSRPRGAVEAYCATLDRINDLDLLSDPAPARVRADLRGLLALTGRAARVAPAEVRADAEAAVVAQIRFNLLYAAHGWDPEATNRDREFLALANSPELGGLYVRLEEYQGRTCGPDRPPGGPLVA